MQQVIIDFGKVNLFGHPVAMRIYGYGLMLVLGFICAVYLARRRAQRFGEDPDAVTTLGLLSLVGGIVGARLAYVIEKWSVHFAWRSDPLGEVFNITSGGLIYYGGVILAVAAVLPYMRLRRLPIRRYLDILAPVVMLGLGFGRMGCTLNGCCFGRRCKPNYFLAMRFPYASKPLLKFDDSSNIFGGASVSPVFSHQAETPPGQGGIGTDDIPDWLLRRDEKGELMLALQVNQKETIIKPAGRFTPEELTRARRILKRPSELTDEQARRAADLLSLPVQPAQVFGIVNALLIAGVLWCFSRLRRREGQVFALMLILYPITRFALEGLRGDNPHNLFRLELTHNQYTSVGMIGLGLLLLFGLRFLPAGAGPFRRGREEVSEPQPRQQKQQRKGKH